MPWSRLPALSESARLRYLAFTLLYFAQGVPWGFIAVGYVVFLTDQGLDNLEIGAAIGLAYVPWSFKILWGPLIDRVTTRWGRRRPFIVVAELFMGLTIASLALIDPVAQLSLVGWILFAHNTAASVQDVAVDALAVDLLPDDQRGRANSLMWAGKSLGVALGGGAGTALAARTGWTTLFIVLAMVIWTIMLVPLLLRERPADAPEDAAGDGRFGWRPLLQSFNFATPWLGVLVAVLTPFGYAMAGTVFTRALRADLGLTEDAIAVLTGAMDPLSGVAGALLGGLLADRLGPRKAMGAGMAFAAVCLFAFGVVPDSLRAQLPFLAGYTIALNLGVYAYNAASLAFFMKLSNPAIGATQFAVFMAATNLTYSISSPSGGYIADKLGVPALFVIAAVIQVAMIGLLPLCDPEIAAKRFRRRADGTPSTSTNA